MKRRHGTEVGSGRARRIAPGARLALAVTAAVLVGSAALSVATAGAPRRAPQPIRPAATAGPVIAPGRMVAFGYNELGMHCMNQDFADLCILPPYNNLHVQVIDRREDSPKIVNSDIAVTYSIPGNTRSSNKTNFWLFAPKLFGTNLLSDVGLTGNRLSGSMRPSGSGDYVATGIPNTPINDAGRLDPYQLAQINVTFKGTTMARTATPIPVSWEISCNLCHSPSNPALTARDILARHDARHGTKLMSQRPVLCAKCHADPALGTTGVAGVSTLSHAMHGSHAQRVKTLPMANTCYACHPGFQTNCQRDVHFTRGIGCTDCHGSMEDVADPARKPWADEPKCATCHQARRPGFEFEEPGKNFKESRGHHGVRCTTCHGSPHAVTPVDPRITNNDNLQAIGIQGFAGTIRKCSVCHNKTPEHAFDHRLGDD